MILTFFRVLRLYSMQFQDFHIMVVWNQRQREDMTSAALRIPEK